MDPGSVRRFACTLVIAVLLGLFIPQSFARAEVTSAGNGTDGIVRVTAQTVYVDGLGKRWIDGVVENISVSTLADVKVPVILMDGTVEVSRYYVDVDVHTLAAGAKATFHSELPGDSANYQPLALYGGGWTTNTQPLELEVVSVTPAGAAYSAGAVTTQTEASCDHVCHEEPQGPTFEPRTYTVVLRNNASVPVSDIVIGGSETQGATLESGTLLDTLSGRGDQKVLAPGETLTLEVRGEAAEDADAATSIATELRAQALEAPSMLLRFSTLSPNYGSSVQFSMRLTDSKGLPVLGERTLKLYSSTDGENWKYTPYATVNGVMYGTVKPLQRVYYKAVFWSDGTYASAFSPITVVQPTTEVTTPKIVPTSIGRGRPFRASGFILPDHAAGMRQVKLLCYHREGGAWVLRRTVYTTTGAYPGPRATYAATVSLPKAGRWAIRSYHPADSRTRADVSSSDYITVR